MKRRVVITGIGVVSPFGTGTELFWKSLIDGVSATRRIQSFDPVAHSSQVAGEVIDFDPSAFIDKKEMKRLDRFAQFAIVAGKLALADSGLKIEQEQSSRIGSIVGCGIGGISTMEAQCRVLFEKGPDRVSPFLVPMMISNMASGNMAISLGIKGLNFVIASACASGTHAIGESFHKVQTGELDVAFSGGVEAAVTPLTVAGFSAMKALSTYNDCPEKASRPFDKTRNGFVIAEGGAILVLEELEHARARNARIYAEVIGYAGNDDAHHITAPALEGAAGVMKLALENAGISAADVQYINAHGTSTPLNDQNESKAVHAVFGEHAAKLKVSSIKSMIGHLLGAAGAVEAAATAMTIADGVIPPTINYHEPDPECALDVVPNQAVKMDVRHAISNSFGFGGHNGCVVLKKYS
ncbi:MAG: beta-ketoacyl-ACP synthase II [Candidatus Wallbacteria bacterium]|nr:beta-ketoacyl-ACP synthase II [Candidatus Wallbacteria bacterium]